MPIQDSYEEFIVQMEEVRESLDLLHHYLNCSPEFSDRESYFDLIGQHAPNFALLNLVRGRMDDLIKEHKNILINQVKGA